MASFRKPNFLIVGAAKAGTTSLAKYLSQHEDIFVPEKKELRFFVRNELFNANPEDPLINWILRDSVLDEKEYFGLFEGNERLAGEASVHYLYHYNEAILNIKKYIGDVKIIIILRDPVKRLISNYEFLYNAHFSDLQTELDKEDERRKKGYNAFWYYKSLGLYSNQVKAYLENFTQVKVLLFEDFIENTKTEMDGIFKFLGVTPIDVDHKIYNVTTKHTVLRRLFGEIGLVKLMNSTLPENLKENLKHKTNFLLNSKKKSIHSKELINELYSFFETDIKELESIINRDLSIWKAN
jgi:hypothetical protein